MLGVRIDETLNASGEPLYVDYPDPTVIEGKYLSQYTVLSR